MLWLLFLLLWGHSLPPSHTCTTESKDKCQAAQPVPGSNLGGEGFDVVTMERKGAYVVDVERWERKTDKTCTLCSNPYLDNQKQKLPLTVTDWRALPQCKLQVASTVYESSEQFVESEQNGVHGNWKIGLDVHNKASIMVGGTHSKLAKMAMDKSKKDKYSFIRQEVHCTYYSYRLVGNPPLHREFVRSLQHLPPHYDNATKVQYRNLLDTYGTHFIKKVQLGGRVTSITAVRTCQAALSGYTESEVKDCLEAEVSAPVHSATISAETRYCKNDLKQRNTKENFHSHFSDRTTEVEGGQTAVSDLLFSNKPEAFQEWMNSLKTVPGVVTYSLDPLHLLVKKPNTKKAGLKKALEDYIIENALYKHCSKRCSGGSIPSSHDSCKCVCKPNNVVNSNCCPVEPALARFSLKVERATGLWGDTFSATDSFLKISFSSKNVQTKVIYNNNNPQWNEEFSFGMVKLAVDAELEVQVWDEDKEWYKWWNDNLGQCKLKPVDGSHPEICPLNHGTLFFSYKVECEPGLQGARCESYNPSPMDPSQATLYASRNAINLTSSLLTHIREGHTVEDPLLFLDPLYGKNISTILGLSGKAHPHAFSEL